MGVEIVGIGASAGGFESVIELLSVLPGDFPAPVVVAIHGGPNARLAESLRFLHEPGPAIREARDGEALEPGVVYCIPAVRHGYFADRVLRISDKVENSGFRPSIDALFMTMAACFGPSAVGVVLSGMMEDGMRGAQVLHDLGGVTLVQDPSDAAYPQMPKAVIRADHPRRILPAGELGEYLDELVRR